jgi:Icc-related predicted phosphoesterase
VHGSEVLWRKFINAGKFYEAGVLVMGGDIAGKAVVPIIEREGGYSVQRVAGDRLVTADELPGVESRIRDLGLYPHRMQAGEMAGLETDTAAMAAVFMKAMLDGFERWLDLAAQRLKGTGITLFVMIGNDDEPALREVLESSAYAIDSEDQVVDVGDGYQMVSCGWSNPTPWNSPRELPEEELGKKMEAMVLKLDDPATSIFNFHVPPYGTQLDRAPSLDRTLKPIVRGGQVLMESVGSKEVRRLIERYQPAVTLHGHIHEARGAVKLGRSVCINPGSVYSEGALHGVLIELARGKSPKYQLTSG